MQKINLRELYPDVYKTDVFVDVAEEVLAVIRGQEQDDAAYERRKFRHKAHYSLNREDGIENDALNRPLTPEEILEQKHLREEVYAALMQLTAIQARRIYARFYLGMTVAELDEQERMLVADYQRRCRAGKLDVVITYYNSVVQGLAGEDVECYFLPQPQLHDSGSGAVCQADPDGDPAPKPVRRHPHQPPL